MVCAGICASKLTFAPGKRKTGGGGERSLAWQALKTNVCCGDFIEAAYPFMERSQLVNASAYIAGGLASELLMQRRVLSTAYFPLPLAVWISNDRIGMVSACAVAFGVSFVGTSFSNVLSWL